MWKYYQDKSIEYRSNTKKLWELMNGIINKTKHKVSIIPYVTVEGIKIYNRKMIANEFGKFYANLGGSLVEKISKSKTTGDEYISRILRLVKSLVFTETNQTESQKDHQ